MTSPAHNPLGGAHRGYEFQDAAVAYLMLWALYHGAAELVVDRKAYQGDLFDDVTIRLENRVIRCQFKSSASSTLSFTEEHLKTKTSDLRIDDLVTAFRLAGPNSADEYRLCSTWQSPQDPLVLALLLSVDVPGSFGSFPTKRWKVNVGMIWPEGGTLVWNLRNQQPITRPELVAFASRFVIELECPQISLDPVNPVVSGLACTC